MATLQNLKDAIAAEKAAAEAKVNTLNAQVTALTDQVTQLQTQIGSGVLLSPADLDALVTAVQGISA